MLISGKQHLVSFSQVFSLEVLALGPHGEERSPRCSGTFAGPWATTGCWDPAVSLPSILWSSGLHPTMTTALASVPAGLTLQGCFGGGGGGAMDCWPL